jgi:hypothetical protein
VFMILGQSSATAAVLALDAGISVQDLDYKKLRERSLQDKQVLDLPKGAPPKPVLSISKLPGVVIDDSQAQLTGEWTVSGSIPPFVEDGYRHDGNADKGQKSARFEAKLSPGRYEVRIAFAPSNNRSPRVPIAIEHSEGTATKHIDQRKAPKDPHGFLSLGSFTFGDKGALVVSNAGTDAYVVIDAVQFLPEKGAP